MLYAATTQSIVNAIIGGCFIGLSASLLLLAIGRISGISGIIGEVLTSALPGAHNTTHKSDSDNWRYYFLGGMIIGALIIMAFLPQAIAFSPKRNLGSLALAGLCVGYGTRLGSGCTSGHGICGLTRFSKRSFVAVCAFMFSGVVMASLYNTIQYNMLLE